MKTEQSFEPCSVVALCVNILFVGVAPAAPTLISLIWVFHIYEMSCFKIEDFFLNFEAQIYEITNLKMQENLFCLFIDEAYLLTANEFQWLCDLYNELNISGGIQLTCLLISTREILDVKKGFIRAGKQQIVQRLMLKEAEFHGIESLTDLYICMNALDNNFTPQGYDEPICLSETYFPDAHHDGKNLASFSQAFWTAMQNLRKENNINANYMTMKCFMDSVSYCLRKFGVGSGDNRVYEPSVAEWEACLIASAYVSSQV